MLGLGKFDKDASRYHPAVYQRKRADLLAALHSSLSPLFLGQLKNLHKKVSSDFAKRLQEGLGGKDYDFAKVVDSAKTARREEFVQGAKGKYNRYLASIRC